MPIDVTCPGCRSRFQVSEKYAGKQGPCPKCKKVITVPKLEEQVKIVGGEASGPTDSKGRPVLKPIAREETKLTQKLLITIFGSIALVLVCALFVRLSYKVSPKKPAEVPITILAFGAIVLAPALSFAGYSFLRDSELEPYRGKELYVRIAITGAAYALLWLVYYGVKQYFLAGATPQTYTMLVILPPFVLIGGFAAFASYDLDYGSGLMHYGLFLLVTVLLRVMVGMPAL